MVAGRRPVKGLSLEMLQQVLTEFEAPDRWIYLAYDDFGSPYFMTREQWDHIFRPSPEDQS
jgi:hypothetical protein